jgi:hypothetical protein
MYLQLVCRIVLILVFGLAAAGKLRSRRAWREFKGSVRELGIGAARPVAAVTVAAECGVTASMMVSGLVRAGFVLALALLAALTGGILFALRAGRSASCRCFGGDAERYGPAHVARNATLALIAAIGAVAGPPAGYAVAGIVTSALAAAVAAIVVVRLSDFLSILIPAKTRS